MILLLNIGNTHTAWATIQNEHILPLGQIKTNDFLSLTQLPWASHFFIASVVPEKNALFASEQSFFLTPQTIMQKLNFAPFFEGLTVGADRLANALALQAYWQSNAISIDVGSCITFELLNALGEFAGGVILPGRQLSRFAMTSHTAQLFKTDLLNKLPCTLANNSQQAMQFGIDIGLVGAIEAHIERFISMGYNPNHIIFTGGDAPFFIESLKKKYCVDPLLTFKGLALFAQS